MRIRPAVVLGGAFVASAPSLAIQFGEPQTLTSHTTYVQSMVAADMTGDGWPDVLTGVSLDDRVVYFPRTGPGSFGPAAVAVDLSHLETSTLALAIYDVEAADFNGDGLLDLLILTGESGSSGGAGVARVSLAAGAGGWEDSFEVARAADAGVICSAVDYDGDGAMDVLYSVLEYSSTTQEMRVRLGRGDGTFDPEVILSSGDGIQSGLRGAIDFDGDGDVDVLDAPDYATLGFRRNEGPAGLAPRVLLEPQGFGTMDPVLADLDGDGDIDVVQVFELPASVLVYLNDGAGHFGVGVPLPLSGRVIDGLVAIDADLDGRLDLVGAVAEDDLILLFRGLGAGAFADPVPFIEGDGARTSQMVGADVDLDGLDDLLVAEYAFDDGPSGSRVVLHQNGLLGMEPPRSLTSTAFGAPGLEAVDLDSDGDDELLFASGATGAMTSMENLGFAEAGGFGHPVELDRTFPISGGAAAGDLDGDGDADLVMQSLNEDYRSGFFLLENLGDRGFGAPELLFGNGQGQVAMGDFDGDGDVDLAFSIFQGTVSFRENVGSLRFVAGVELALPGGLPTQLVSGDLTGDGVDDLVVLSRTAFPAVGFATLIPGSLTGPGAMVALPQGASVGMDAAIGDLNGDGRPDLVVLGGEGDGLRWIAGAPGGAFEQAVALSSQTGEVVAAADLDLDGATDLVVSSYGSGTSWLRGLGGGSFGSPVLLMEDSPSFALVDVERDGDLDLALLNLVSGTISVLENLTRDRLGTSVCGPAIPNSTGASGETEALGSEVLGENRLTLRARRLPPGVIGLWLAARTSAVTFPVTGSAGRLCLDGAIGRFSAPGEIQESGPGGRFALTVDLSALPTPGGSVPALAGEAWYFQAWHRDAGSSNFTDAKRLVWQ